MITSRLVRQFGNPHGPLGRIAGRIMATRTTNVERNRWIVQLLAPTPDADILEIGHGPGLAIEAIWPDLTTGHVVGLDVSPLMSNAARHRNRSGIEAGRVTLRTGDAQRLPDDLDGFDVIYGVNVSKFWTDPASTIAALARRLKPDGRLTLSYMRPPTSNTAAKSVGAELVAHFTSAQLSDIVTDTFEFDPPAIAVTGRRAA